MALPMEPQAHCRDSRTQELCLRAVRMRRHASDSECATHIIPHECRPSFCASLGWGARVDSGLRCVCTEGGLPGAVACGALHLISASTAVSRAAVPQSPFAMHQVGFCPLCALWGSQHAVLLVALPPETRRALRPRFVHCLGTVH